jgi:hypothetical protein
VEVFIFLCIVLFIMALVPFLSVLIHRQVFQSKFTKFPFPFPSTCVCCFLLMLPCTCMYSGACRCRLHVSGGQQ